MLKVSNKGTVPVLLLPDNGNRVIDESIEIMYWAMTENQLRHKANSKAWAVSDTLSIKEVNTLIEQNDVEFKSIGKINRLLPQNRHTKIPTITILL